MQPKIWGYNKYDDGRHRTAEEIVDMLAYAWGRQCNLLLNTGPLEDGSIDEYDASQLRAVGEILRRDGFPTEARPYPEMTAGAPTELDGQTEDLA